MNGIKILSGLLKNFPIPIITLIPAANNEVPNRIYSASLGRLLTDRLVKLPEKKTVFQLSGTAEF